VTAIEPWRATPCHYGQLIRKKDNTGGAKRIIYIVAVAEAGEVIAIIRTRQADCDCEIEDFGRVSEELLASLAIPSGEYLRIEAMAPLGSE
jgi:hypothetical protein